MIIIFTHINFSRIWSPARNAQEYVLRENVYVLQYKHINIYIYMYVHTYICRYVIIYVYIYIYICISVYMCDFMHVYA